MKTVETKATGEKTPISYKVMGYVFASSGFVFLSFAVALAFFSHNSSPEAMSSVFPVIAVCLASGIVLVFGGLAGFWADYLRSRKSQLVERAKIQQSLLVRIKDIQEAVNAVLNSGTYLIHSNKKRILSRIEDLRKEVNAYAIKKMLDANFVDKASENIGECTQQILNYNPNFVQQRKKDYKFLWNKANYSLDDEQQTAIIKDDEYNLVVAAAGSGKTEVLITRIAYLTKREPDTIKPNRILAIAYQNKAREQIENRLRDQYSIGNVNVRTFHKLGKDILDDHRNSALRKTKIVNDNKKKELIKLSFEKQITNPEFYQLFLQYVRSIYDEEEKPTEKDENAAVYYAKEHKYLSINGTKVNSIAEKEIMDWLLTHRINDCAIDVKYEPDEISFEPDFYLPPYDIYIEHLGLTKSGEVPPSFRKTTQEYLHSLQQKEEMFANNNKILIKTYSYEFNRNDPTNFFEVLEARLHEALERKYQEKEVRFSCLSYKEISQLVWDSQLTPISDIVRFVTIAKTYGLTPDKVEKKLEENRWSRKQRLFGKLALQVFKDYEEELKKQEKIDFEDMINKSIEALNKDPHLYEDKYDHILVDEYQDISNQRLRLLRILLDRNPKCKLFCVGDDWQSIMGFSGSNLSYFVEFEKSFPNSEVSEIRTNYRSIKSIVDAGATLIKNNGNEQRQKETLAKSEETKKIQVLELQHQKGFDVPYYKQMARHCLAQISEFIEYGYSQKDILVLTRYMQNKVQGRSAYNKIVQTFKTIADSEYNYIRIDEEPDKNIDSNSVKLLTVHKSKGLEARVVFVLNVVKGKRGFPSEIEDPSILEVAREDDGIKSQIEEERRLFYVAITRAKEDLYIYTRLHQKSDFLDEISGYTEPIRLPY